MQISEKVVNLYFSVKNPTPLENPSGGKEFYHDGAVSCSHFGRNWKTFVSTFGGVLLFSVCWLSLFLLWNPLI